VLRQRDDILVACSSLKVSGKARQDWAKLAHEKEFFHGASFKENFGTGEMMLFSKLDSPDRAFQTRCIPHCLPLWKKQAHRELGMFDETLYGTAADYEFWLRIAGRRGNAFWLEKQLLGFYFVNESSYMRRNESRALEARKLLFLVHFRELYRLFYPEWPALCLPSGPAPFARPDDNPAPVPQAAGA
jgi:hypothetical protein